VPVISQTQKDKDKPKQKPREAVATPIAPGGVLLDSWIGPVLGINWNIQSGTFFSACDCPFTEGAKATGIVGVEFMRELSSSFSAGVRLALESRSLTARFVEYEEVPLQSPASEEIYPTLIPFRNNAELTLGAISIAPYLRWHPTKWLFLQAAAIPTFITGNNILHEKEIIQRRVTLPNGELADVRFDQTGRTTITLEDGEFPAESFQFGAGLGVGFSINLGDNTKLLPMYQYVIPLTEASKQGEQFRIASSQLTIALLLRL
jgi:hypothetical protein